MWLLVSLVFTATISAVVSGQDAWGASEGNVNLLEPEIDATARPKSKKAPSFKEPTRDLMGKLDVDWRKLSSAKWKKVAQNSGGDAIRGDGVGMLSKASFQHVQKWADAHPFVRTSAEEAANASPKKLQRLKEAGKVDEDGCPRGVGAYGFEQYPFLSGVVTTSDNSVAVIMLHNYDFNDHWQDENEESWRDISEHATKEATLAFEEGTFLGWGSNHTIFSNWGYCPSYAANGGRTRQTFQGQARFSCLFADGTITKPIDKAPEEVTCATSLRVWCPIPTSVQAILAKGQKVVKGVQLIREHLDPRYPSAEELVPPTIYPVAQICPRKRSTAKKAKLAVCAQYDPSWDEEKKVEEWMLWNLGAGVDHIYLYYMEGQTADMPVPGAGGSVGVLGVKDEPKFSSIFRAAQKSGHVTIRKWDRWPNWWFNTTWATKSAYDRGIPERDWRILIAHSARRILITHSARRILITHSAEILVLA